MRFIKVLLLLVIFILGLMFFVQNSTALEAPLKLQFDLYFKDMKWLGEGIPYYFVVLAAFGVGMLFATLLLFFDRIRIGCELMRRKRDVRDLKTEIRRLGGNADNVTIKDRKARKEEAARAPAALETKAVEVKKELPADKAAPKSAAKA